MRISVLGIVTLMVGIALAHPASLEHQDDSSADAAFDYGAAHAFAAKKNPEITQSNGGGGLVLPQNPCTEQLRRTAGSPFPLEARRYLMLSTSFPARDGCQTVDLLNDHGGRKSEFSFPIARIKMY
ncbi:uncharacterized protein N0V89_007012 [Didymosphaeria variabile]|uniref:Uncharacterized protein n=1 Tax=Didymosphaeria variabile TaxID=1932322 RepID=A0A9W9C934_9PLEO|nr:uncharacterized protein N0V89_007012 [Didymosphaeria variabile]KAJ4351669.1 hypothetical protein N0V89_007012 [Didymosphaeria variabile]